MPLNLPGPGPLVLFPVEAQPPVAGDSPPAPVVVEVDDRRKRLPLLQPFIGDNQYLAVPPPATPTAPAPTVVENDQGRRRQPLLQPFVQFGSIDNGVGVPGTAPPLPVSLDRADQKGRYRAPDPTVINGELAAAATTPAADTPPPPTVVDRADQRARYRPLDPIVLSAALAGFTAAPTVTPPGPYVVPLEERRRFLQAIQPTVQHGFDDQDTPEPPEPTVVEPDSRTRRIRLPDPVVLVGPAPDTTVQVNPPGPTVVGFDGARRPLLLPPTFQHGLVLPGPGPVGTTPPPVNVVPLVQRPMYFVALPPVRYRPFVEPVVSPTATGVNQDFASIVSGW